MLTPSSNTTFRNWLENHQLCARYCLLLNSTIFATRQMGNCMSERTVQQQQKLEVKDIAIVDTQTCDIQTNELNIRCEKIYEKKLVKTVFFSAIPLLHSDV